MERSGFGERLRRRRIAAGLTQEDLAARSGLTAKGIAALERGRRQRPYPHTVKALAVALGLSDDEQAELAGNPPASGAASPPTPLSHLPVVPAPPTPTIGRNLAVEAVLDCLARDGDRLVTLTGPGGVGKTRLALVVAGEAAGLFPDGVVFVPLASLTDPDLVVPTILSSLDHTERAERNAPDALAAVLHGRRLLLVLDNLEHLLPASHDVAGLLASFPELKILATSRSPLRLRGEREYPVPPLVLPDLRHIPTRAEVAAADAVALFVERAQASSPMFTLTQDNATAIAAICRRLDGLPLALELAAARMRVLTPTELLARLDQALPLLTGGARDLPERQRTMHQAIGWSYRLLNPAEQALFRRLSVFAGGWDAAAAQAIGGGTDPHDTDILDVLSGLVEHSLVVSEATAEGTTRYRMLETIRAFGQEQLAATAESGAVRQRHAALYLSLAESAEPELRGPEQGAWLRRLEMEHPNLRAALTWAIESSHPEHREQGLRVAGALWLFWFVRGHDAEGEAWLDRLLAASDDLPSAARARALFAAGMLSTTRLDTAGATVRFEAGLRAAKSTGSRSIEALAWFGLGDCARLQHDFPQASLRYETAVRLFRELDDRAWIGSGLNGLAMVALAVGDIDRIERLTDEALVLLGEAGDTWSLAETCAIAAEAARRQGDTARAAPLFARALATFWEQGDRRASSGTVEGVAALAVSRGQAELATRIAGAVAAARKTVLLAGAATAGLSRSGKQAIDEARRMLDEGAFTRAWEAGQSLTLDDVVVDAMTFIRDLAAEPATPAVRAETAPAGLSAREVEVLQLLAAGMTNREIAERLFLSEHTIRAHLRRIYPKLDVTTRTEAVRFAVKHHLG